MSSNPDNARGNYQPSKHKSAEQRVLKMIAVGASAGGLESLERFFDGVVKLNSTAFVVIQHLSPNYETMMDQLLARHTSMEVSIVTDGTKVKAKHVYVIPPKKEMTVKHGRLHLVDKTIGQIPHLPIDRFFESMASEYGDQCAAVVLSGTGSDGTKGIGSVHSAGGLVLAETETTAKFTGMPRSATQSGRVHHTVPPESMGDILANHVMGASNFEHTDENSGEFATVFDLMRSECQIDFRHYKASTVTRRIDRRMQLAGSLHLNDYIELLRADRRELRALYQDMLIGVTKFFRDENCFEFLETEILPRLYDQANPDTGLRVWVAGCATGEEAYSMAILLDEVRQRHNNNRIEYKIFASDLHPGSLETAGRGVYNAHSLANVSAERLDRYFERRDDDYCVKPELRRNVLFSPHNVLQDPPFTDLDMVSCRNLLIYFDNGAQRKALTLFHFGLKKNGILFLGPSETVGELSHEFQVIDEQAKIYSRRRDAKLPDHVRLPISLKPRSAYELQSRRGVTKSDVNSKLDTYNRLLDTVMPRTLLIDSQRKVVECFGGAEELLRIPARTFSNDLLDVVPEDLKTAFSAVFRRVQKAGSPVRVPITDVSLLGEVCTVNIQASPLFDADDQEGLYAFQLDVLPQMKPSSLLESDDAELISVSNDHRELIDRIRELEDELGHSRENLQATIEELESSNEELQAANEELISSNEELQSTNEELNSVNEELHTVNVEYQNKNAQLRELNEDLNHLFSSTEIGTIFLDQSLAIRRFTPRMGEIFNLEVQDTGRELTKFSHSLLVDDLHDLIAETLAGAQSVEREVQDKSGSHFYMQILPYVVEGNIAGVILTLTDITSLVDARNLARSYQNRLQRSIDAVPVFVAYINSDEEYEYANRSYLRSGLMQKGKDIHGTKVRDILGSEAYNFVKPHIRKVLQGEEQNFEIETEIGGKLRVLAVSYVPNRLKSGKVKGFYVSATDITASKTVERELERAANLASAANEAKSDFLAKMSHEIRSPMTAILGFADILAQQLKHPDNRDCVEVIRNNGIHLLDLINDILDLSRVESGKMELEEETFNPGDLMRECYNTIIPRTSSASVSLSVQVNSAVESPYLGDRRRLKQVVLNLLSNAVKFCERGQVELTATRKNQNGSDRLVISVQDEGCGIDPNSLASLFEPFAQADNSDKRRFEGTGLGLAITKQLTQQMGGEIEVESELNEGSVFTVSIPWRDGAIDAKQQPIFLDEPAPRLDGKLVVVIDDRRDVRFLAEHLLRDAGAEVRTADDGKKGIELCKNLRESGQPPDCIITDIQMPEMDGYETTEELRSAGFHNPIIALSASAMLDEQEKCYAAGCDAHLSKPINKSALVRTVCELIRVNEKA